VHGFSFSTEVKVRFAETDAQGIAHNSNYFVWFEVARVEYLARFDERLTVHARCLDVRGARFRYEYAIERGGSVIADGWTAHATVDAQTMRPTRVPSWLQEAISAAESSSSSSTSS
jgi:acyl-CoA thioester hydrolase